MDHRWGARWIATGAMALLPVFPGAGCRSTETPRAAEQKPPADASVPELPRPSPPPEPAFATAPYPAPEWAGACPETNSSHIGVLVSPQTVVAGQPFRVLAATLEGETPLSVRLEHEGDPVPSDGVTFTYRGGIPAATTMQVASAAPGKLRIVVGREGEGLACTSVSVASRPTRTEPRGMSGKGVWPIERSWGAGEEAVFSAWVRELFHAPRGEDLAWSALHEVTAVPERNLLHDHYGWNEDALEREGGLYLKPDCADAPYFLRAYYAWKRQLPFGFRKCSRGRGSAPRCGGLQSILGSPENAPDARKPGELGGVQYYFRRTLAWGVHSGNGRTAFDNDKTDFYPLELSRRALRPGMIYADPYGHIFVVVELMESEDDKPAVLYAIDGQPDGSITRKRFWEGNFLWNPDPALGGSGFKGFRPLRIERTEQGTAVVAASNEGIASLPGYGDLSEEQSRLTAPEFYDRMDAIINPGYRDPYVAQREAIAALHEAAKVRVTSVINGDEFVRKSGGTIEMPQGFAIFETTGAWENYSTPARDLRLLIAIDLVEGFEDKVRRNAEVFVQSGETLEAIVERLRKERAEALEDPSYRFEYVRSDGSKWPLRLIDLVQRAKAFEVGYNPNDCPEVRWGAAPKSPEYATCRRRASVDQRKAMEAYRPWFAERRRPARGDSGPPSEN